MFGHFEHRAKHGGFTSIPSMSPFTFPAIACSGRNPLPKLAQTPTTGTNRPSQLVLIGVNLVHPQGRCVLNSSLAVSIAKPVAQTPAEPSPPFRAVRGDMSRTPPALIAGHSSMRVLNLKVFELRVLAWGVPKTFPGLQSVCMVLMVDDGF